MGTRMTVRTHTHAHIIQEVVANSNSSGNNSRNQTHHQSTITSIMVVWCEAQVTKV